MPTEDGRKERRHSSGHRKRSRSPDDRDSSRKSNRHEDGHEKGQRRRSEEPDVVPRRPPRQDWAKDENGYWSKHIFKVADNPHLHQLSENELQVIHEEELTRVLTDESPRLPYRRRRGERKSTVHWGQRKLLLSEIEFLTLFSEPGVMVVYAGAAPGTHTASLARLFPEVHQFVLVDPSPFIAKSSDRIVVRQEYFTAEVAKEFVGKKTLFISDVRTAQWRHMDSAEVERAVAQDMAWQREWHEIMCPLAGMHKFRLPWKAGLTEYLDGEVYLPIWGPQTTTEARLISTGGVKQWDNSAYEERMFYFNTVTRLTAVDHDVESDGLDHCYDCAAEVHVLRRYLTKYAHLWMSEEEKAATAAAGGSICRDRMRVEIAKMIETISHECSPHSGRSLRTSLPAPEDRKKAVWFTSAQFDLPQGRLTEVQHKRENLARAARMTLGEVMQDALAQGPGEGEGERDPKAALWTDLAEPSMGDLSYAEARRGVGGLGDEVPPHTFAYRWVLGAALCVAAVPEDAEKVRDVTCFDSDVFESLLGPLLQQAAAAAPDTTSSSSSSSSSSLPSASPYSSSKPSPYASSSSRPSPYSSSSSSKPAESTSKSKSRGMLLLSCKSGTVYLLRPGSREHAIPAEVTRVMLPLPLGEGQTKDQGEGTPVGYHHLTLLQGVLCLTEEDKQRGQPRQCSLTLTDLHAIQGKSTREKSKDDRLTMLKDVVIDPLRANLSQVASVHRRSGVHTVTIVHRPQGNSKA